jgi:hypothetical protein
MNEGRWYGARDAPAQRWKSPFFDPGCLLPSAPITGAVAAPTGSSSSRRARALIPLLRESVISRYATGKSAGRAASRTGAGRRTACISVSATTTMAAIIAKIARGP